jgi:Rhodopirellula transposase DDE domain
VDHDRAARLPAGHETLITADAGGSNGYRLRLWKKELAALADTPADMPG